jgi:hypothetical protein
MQATLLSEPGSLQILKHMALPGYYTENVAFAERKMTKSLKQHHKYTARQTYHVSHENSLK